MIISLDTETTGVDFAHGAMPFLVTTCDDGGVIRYWEWDVDPLTRRPDVPPDDVLDIIELVDAAELIYLHNAKFDARALAAIGVGLPWDKVRDTLSASHLLASNHRHDLTWCCIEYLGVDIEKYELRVKAVVQECRAIAKRMNLGWKLADEGVPGMPSVKGSSDRDQDKPWKNDMWLPAALANKMVVDGDCHEQEINPAWLDACAQYANADSEHTLPLGLEMERLIRERGYWEVYLHRTQLPRAACEMECRGITAIGDYTESTIQEYEEHVAEAEEELRGIAAGYGHVLELAKGAALNDNMRDFFYGARALSCQWCGHSVRVKHWNGEEAEERLCPKCWKATKRRPSVRSVMVESRRPNLCLPVVWSKKTGNATLDGDAMKQYLAELQEGPALDFVTILADKRAYDTALSYMHAYRRYWVPVVGFPGYFCVHASLNPFATDHLRWASNSPNMQNVSGESKEISNRACFGPLPGREWYRMDFKSIESKIPAYESQEPKLVELFDKPNSPPYWGSAYNLVASIFYPDRYAPHANTDGGFKKAEPRLYKSAKFFWLARQYGAGKAKGDRLAGLSGACDMVDQGLPRLAALQAKYLDDAERLGYVETLPDRTVDPTRGYPILASRTEDGRVLTTTPFNYHISGTACWCKNTALLRCAERCRQWREEGFDAWLVLEVHDELLFDFPCGPDPEANRWRAAELKALMEQSGDDLIPQIPLTVTVEYHARTWEDGVTVDFGRGAKEPRQDVPAGAAVASLVG